MTIASLCATTTSLAAQRFVYSVPGLDTLEQAFIVGGGATGVLRMGEAEVIANSTLQSYWIALHQNGRFTPIIDRWRNTLSTTELTGFYGFSNSGRWDMGLHVAYARGRLDNAAASSPFLVFSGKRDEDLFIDDPGFSQLRFDQSFGGVSHVGLRVRFRPLPGNPKLMLNAGYSLATVKDESKKVQLNADRDYFDIGALYYQPLSSNVFYFFGASLRGFLPSITTDQSLYLASGNFFLIHRTNNRKWTFYPGISYAMGFKPSVYDNNPLIRTSEFVFLYSGAQYAFSTRQNIFVTWGFPLAIHLANPRQSIVRESFTLLNLGGRVAL